MTERPDFLSDFTHASSCCSCLCLNKPNDNNEGKSANMKKSNPSGSEKGKKKKEEEERNKASNLIFSTGLYVYSFPLFTLFCFSRYIYTLKTTVMKTFELKIKSWHFASFLLCQIKIEVGVTFLTRCYNFQFLLQHVNVFKKNIGVLMLFICGLSSRYNVVLVVLYIYMCNMKN